jgi:hypothetical protein
MTIVSKPFRIEYGDSCDVINAIETINEELKKAGIIARVEIDSNPHDGFELCTIVKE